MGQASGTVGGSPSAEAFSADESSQVKSGAVSTASRRINRSTAMLGDTTRRYRLRPSPMAS